MTAPETLNDALRDGWDPYGSIEQDSDCEADIICVETPSERIREIYRELAPLASGVHVEPSRRLRIGVSVHSQLDDLSGIVESYDSQWGLWPWGVRWSNGIFELCSATELALT